MFRLHENACEKGIEHPLVRIIAPYPLGEFAPSIAVSLHRMFPFQERGLIEKRRSVSLVGELVELIEKPVPGRHVARGMDRIDGESVAVMSIREDAARILSNVIRAERQIAAEAMRLEMLFGESVVLPHY